MVMYSRRARVRWMGWCVLGTCMLMTGCRDEDTAKAITEFQAGTTTLATAYQAFVSSANGVEEDHYIDGLVLAPAPYDAKAMAGRDLYSPEQLVLRCDAIKALGAYLGTLAALESGKSAAKIQTDAAAAGTSMSTLDTDVQAVIKARAGSAPDLYAGPVSGVVSVAGNVIDLLEKRHAAKEVRESVLKNDAAVTTLLEVMSTESRMLYARQKSTLSEQQVMVVRAFDAEAMRGGGGASQGQALGGADGLRLMELGDRLKEVHRSIAAQAQADPRAGIKALQKTHEDLIAVMKASGAGEKKRTRAMLMADAKSFVNEVEPLGKNVQTLVSSFH